MIGGAVLNFILGGIMKGGVGLISMAMENRHQHLLATSNVETERLERMYGGEDKLTDKQSRTCRNAIALMIIGTYCFLVAWLVIKDPYLHYRVMIDVTPGLFSGIFGNAVPKETIVVSAGSILWSFIELASMASGYYFVKFGKSR